MGHFIGQREEKMMSRPPGSEEVPNGCQVSLTETLELSGAHSVATSNLFQEEMDPKERVKGVGAEPRKQGYSHWVIHPP